MRLQYFLFLAGICFLLLCCEKDEIKVDDRVTFDGYIDLSISGRSADGELLDESDRYSYYLTNNEEYYSGVYNDGDTLRFSIGRFADINESEYVILKFDYADEVAFNITPSVYYRNNKSNQVIQILSTGSYAIDNEEIEVISYDSITGKVKGNYSMIINFTEDRASILNGTFDVTVKNILR